MPQERLLAPQPNTPLSREMAMAELPSLWTITVSLWTSYIVYGIVWRLYLSPIANFPGSKWAALTLWYEFYFDIIKASQLKPKRCSLTPFHACPCHASMCGLLECNKSSTANTLKKSSECTLSMVHPHLLTSSLQNLFMLLLSDISSRPHHSYQPVRAACKGSRLVRRALYQQPSTR